MNLLRLTNPRIDLSFLRRLWRRRRRVKIESISNEIHIERPNEFGAFDQFPAKEHGDHNGDFDIEGDKIDDFEVRTETFPSLDEDEDGVEPNSDDRAHGVSPVFEGEEVFHVSLAEGGSESERGDADADPGELVGDANDAGC